MERRNLQQVITKLRKLLADYRVVTDYITKMYVKQDKYTMDPGSQIDRSNQK